MQLALNAGCTVLPDDRPGSGSHFTFSELTQQLGADSQTPPGPQSASVLQSLMAQAHLQEPLNLGCPDFDVSGAEYALFSERSGIRYVCIAPTELALSMGWSFGTVADAATTVVRRMVAKRKIFRIERANMLSSFPEPAFSSDEPNFHGS